MAWRTAVDIPTRRLVQADVASFVKTLEVCSAGTIVVVDMAWCNPGGRGWCLYEWNHTYALHGIEALLFVGMSNDGRQRIIEEIDVEKADCLDPKDRAMILAEILENHGSYEAFNRRLKLLLQLRPLSYRVDLQQLWKRCGPTLWNFEAVQNWLSAPRNSHLHAHLEIHHGVTCDVSGISPIVGTRHHKIGENFDLCEAEFQKLCVAEKSLYEEIKQPRRSTGASHTHLGQPTARVLCVMGGAGTGKSTISAAVLRDVLRGKLTLTAEHFCKQTDQRRQEPLGIVKSLVFQLALELPDLAESLLAIGAKLGQFSTLEECCSTLLPLVASAVTARDAVILLDALDEADPPEQQRPGFDPSMGVEAVGNRMVRILVAFLATQLPKNVRFILTTRPDAMLGEIRRVLDRGFKSDGGVVYVEPHALRHEEGLSSGLENNLVRNTILREYNLQPAHPVHVATLNDLYSVYRTIFDGCQATPGAVKLLQVLIAAFEPLSMSLLQQMGLSKHLETLPGWGVLFSIVEHRVYTLHQSLIEWLHAEVISCEKEVEGIGWWSAQLTIGHALLAAQLLEHEIVPATEGDVLRKAFVASEYALRYGMFHLCLC